jgi:Domain of unknown function (DUF1918)
MHAVPGDRLVMCGDPTRVAMVLAVPHADGSPPYVVRWIRSGHIALVSPDYYATIIRAAVGVAAEVRPPPPGTAG